MSLLKQSADRLRELIELSKAATGTDCDCITTAVNDLIAMGKPSPIKYKLISNGGMVMKNTIPAPIYTLEHE